LNYRYHLLALHGRKPVEKIVNRFVTFEIIDEVLEGTRVPTKTGVPPIISGSEWMMPFRSSTVMI
jgi:hypothetical protein